MDYFDILFAKTNGISASSCENTTEALLEATVGYSAKNLFDNKWRQGTAKNITTTSSVCSTSVVKTENGVTHKFKNFNTTFVFRVWGLNQAGMNEIIAGTAAASANVIYDSNYIHTETFEVTNSDANVVAYCVMVRKPETQGAEDWLDIAPSDVPNNLIMCVESPLSIGSFEAYKKPLNEAKQDKIKTLYVAPSLEDTTDEIIIPRSNDINFFIVVCLADGDTDKAVTFMLPQELFGYPCVNGDFSITGSVVDSTHNKLTFGFPNTFTAGKIIRVLGIPNISYEAEE